MAMAVAIALSKAGPRQFWFHFGDIEVGPAGARGRVAAIENLVTGERITVDWGGVRLRIDPGKAAKRVKIRLSDWHHERESLCGRSWPDPLRELAQPLGLQGLQRRGGLHEPDVGGLQEAGRVGHGLQDVTYQGPVAGAHLDQPHRRGPAHQRRLNQNAGVVDFLAQQLARSRRMRQLKQRF